MRTLSRQRESLNQAGRKPIYPHRSTPNSWYRFLPLFVTTLIVFGLWRLGIGQALENWVYSMVLPWHRAIVLNSTAGWGILLAGLGLAGILARLHPRRQLGVLLVLGISWVLMSLILARQHYYIPIATPLLLFGLSGFTVLCTAFGQAYLVLRRSEERYALAVQGSNEGLWDWNLQTDQIFFSSRWQEMLGYPDHSLSHLPEEWFERVHKIDLIALRQAIEDHLKGATPSFEQEYRMRHRDGSYRWMLSRGVAIRNSDGVAVRLVGAQLDITRRKQAEEELWRNAFFDRLTNLPNRAGFINSLQQALDRIQQYSLTSFAVLWLDIDCFELINNSFGNVIGDRLLVATVQRLRSFLPPADVVARMGGDEFAILVNQVQDTNDAVRTAERVQQVLALPFNIDGNEVFLTVSIGIALSSAHYTDPEHLLRDADTAVHRAKSAGRARYQIFDKSMRTRMVGKLLLENDFRRSITPEAYDRCRNLQLLYQPIVQLTTGQWVGFEALVRWRHPEQGILSPDRFIAMAEETGLIVPMSWWVLHSACRQMRKWQLQFPHLPPLTINVNLSSQQFSMPNLIEYIQQILQETGLDGKHLKLEMTESMVMEQAASVVAVLHQIRSLGIQLAIDDFGTGYSSLSYLARFPINTLKVDRTFVSSMDVSEDSLEIVRTIHALAHNLGMDVTAEGVETADQAEKLRLMNCEYGQGYFFSQPLDASVVSNLLMQQQDKGRGMTHHKRQKENGE